MKDVLKELERRREIARMGGGKARIDAQHERGKLTARERIEVFLDEGSFEEFDMFVEHRSTDFGMEKQKIAGDGVVTGWGTVNGRTVFLFAKDFTVFGGSLSEAHAEKIQKVQDMALRNRAPIIGIYDAGGARIQEGVAALGGYAEVFQRNVLASGVIPQISVIMGPCAGGDVYSPAMTDFIFMVRDTSYMFVTGPDVVKTVTNETVTAESSAAPSVHTTKSSIADGAYDNDVEALLQMRRLVDFLPASNTAEIPEIECLPVGHRAGHVARPADPRQRQQALRHQGTDPEDLPTRAISSRSSRPSPRTSSPASAASRAARSASSPTSRWCSPACSTRDASRKAARFVRFCDCFSIPLVTFVDVPGFLPGTAQEYGGLIKHGAKLLFAYAEATVPKVTVITRKAFGGAYDVMASKHLRGDMNYAWPTAQIAVMGAKGAVEIIYRKDIGDAEKIAAHTKAYEDRFLSPFVAAERGYVDEVIMPHSTRRRVARALQHAAQQGPRESLEEARQHPVVALVRKAGRTPSPRSAIAHEPSPAPLYLRARCSPTRCGCVSPPPAS